MMRPKLRPSDWLILSTAVAFIVGARLLIGNRAGRDWIAAIGIVVIVVVLLVRLVGWIRYKRNAKY